MRINEALSVTLDDIDLKSILLALQSVVNFENGWHRISFISAEATQAINEWLKVRPITSKPLQNEITG